MHRQLCALYERPHTAATDEGTSTRFHGIPFVLRLDAATPIENTRIESERGLTVTAAALVDLRKVQNLAVGDHFVIPKPIRATWRIGKIDYLGGERVWSGGTIVGDYTVPFADRIPDDMLDYIRKNGGALRIKIRLKNDGVLIGWDVEERYTTPYGRGLRYVLPGGDFREAQIRDGKVIDPGWQK